jgi:arylsulfatase A-like enzyme
LSDPDAPAPIRAPALLTLAPGLAWGLAQFAAFAFVLEPGPESAAQIAVLFFLCLFVGLVHAGLFAAAAAALGRSPFGRRLPRAADALLAAAAGLVYAWLGISIVKFGQARAHLRFEDLWFLATSARQVAGEGTAAERGGLLFALALPPLAALALYGLLRVARRNGPPLPARPALALAALGLVGMLVVGWRYPLARWATTTLLADTVAVTRGAERGAERVRALAHRAEWKPDATRQARVAPFRPEAPPRRWNLIVLMLESVPWRRVFGPDARPDSAPHLAALARESVVFDRAYATSSHSDYAQTSILSSLYPRKGEEHDYFFEIDYPRALPWDVLGPLGWRSAVVSCQNERWGNMIAFIDTPRLERLVHAPDFPAAPRRGTGSQTKVFEGAIVDDFLAWAAAEPERPFVAYLNFQATHFPYVWPPGFRPPFGEAPLDFQATFLGYPTERVPLLLDRFHNAFAYADAELGRLIAGLSALGRWDDTALVLVADHGEAFYEHGLPTHGTTVLEEQVRVPLVLRLPGETPRVVVEPVSVLDALPTVYRAMGLPRHGALQGRDDVLDPSYAAGERPIFFSIQGMTHEDGVLEGSWKLIVNHDRRESALFDLARDPDERYNLALDAGDRRLALDSTLARFLALQLGYYRADGWDSGWFAPRVP